MTFTNKSLDDLLIEISFDIKDAKELSFSGDKTQRTLSGTYSTDYEHDYGSIERTTGRVRRDVMFVLSIILDIRERDIPNGCISEVISNAVEWGEGVPRVNYYFTERGVVVDISQYKFWNPTTNIEKVKQGLHPSSRHLGNDHSMEGGGCGLNSAKQSKYIVAYAPTSTLLLLTKDAVINYGCGN